MRDTAVALKTPATAAAVLYCSSVPSYQPPCCCCLRDVSTLLIGIISVGTMHAALERRLALLTTPLTAEITGEIPCAAAHRSNADETEVSNENSPDIDIPGWRENRHWCTYITGTRCLSLRLLKGKRDEIESCRQRLSSFFVRIASPLLDFMCRMHHNDV